MIYILNELDTHELEEKFEKYGKGAGKLKDKALNLLSGDKDSKKFADTAQIGLNRNDKGVYADIARRLGKREGAIKGAKRAGTAAGIAAGGAGYMLGRRKKK